MIRHGDRALRKMTKRFAVLILLLLTASAACLGKREETDDQLLARAEAAPIEKQSDLFLELSEREMKTALESFSAGRNDEARSALQKMVEHCGRAHQAAIKSRKRLKHTEIKLRKISGRLRDVKMSIDLNSQPQVQAAIDRLEDFRTELLKAMFGSKNND
jgi:hypothetical protein